jgi:hypothetical protein
MYSLPKAQGVVVVLPPILAARANTPNSVNNSGENA